MCGILLLSPIAVWKCLCKIDARNDSTEAIVYVNCGTTIHLHGFDLIFCFVSTFCNAIRYNGINIKMNSPRLENISWKSDIGGIARLTQLKNAALYAFAHILFNRFFCFITNYCVWKTIHLVVVAGFFLTFLNRCGISTDHDAMNTEHNTSHIKYAKIRSRTRDTHWFTFLSPLALVFFERFRGHCLESLKHLCAFSQR